MFITESDAPGQIISRIAAKKRWREPSLERFLYDFLMEIVDDDLRLLEQYDHELSRQEADILADKDGFSAKRVNEIHNAIRRLKNHYEQLTDLGQLLEENENGFFDKKRLRYFRTFLTKIDRLHDKAMAVDDYTHQLRGIYKTHIEIRQNHIMQVLTIVTTVFFPLMVIVGWFGMNFSNMSELESPYGYPICIAVSIIIVVGSLLYFKRKSGCDTNVFHPFL